MTGVQTCALPISQVMQSGAQRIMAAFQGMLEDVTWPHKGSAVFLRPAFKRKLAAAQRDS